MLKKAAVIGIAGLALGVSPAAADSIGDGGTAVLTMVGGGGLMAIGCMAVALLDPDDEDDGDGYDRQGFYTALSGSYARENFNVSAVTNLVDGELQDNLRILRDTPDDMGTPTDPTDDDPGVYTLSLDDLDEDVFGFLARAGYRCNSHVSVEYQSEWLEIFKGTIAENRVPLNDTMRRFDLELESLVVTSNVKGHLLTGRYQPFVLAGFGFMRMENKTNDITPAALPRPPSCPPGPDTPCFAAQASDRRVELAVRFGAGLDFYVNRNVVVSAEASYLMPTGKLDKLDYYSFGLGLQYRF
jgi:opacity protein-like surface antigen